jgi:alkyl sulfatase BDS1-like metallo-beta-lactamase superfamily hydrolase
MSTAELQPETPTASCRPFAASIMALPLSFQPAVSADLRMRVHVATTGPEPGNWLIVVEDGVCRVYVGSVPQTDARLYTDSEVGRSILTGETSIRRALTSGLLDYEGDPVALQRFRSCFQFGGSS